MKNAAGGYYSSAFFIFEARIESGGNIRFSYAKTRLQLVILLVIVAIEICGAGLACWMIASNCKRNGSRSPGCGMWLG
jgi:hypothetical protein